MTFLDPRAEKKTCGEKHGQLQEEEEEGTESNSPVGFSLPSSKPQQPKKLKTLKQTIPNTSTQAYGKTQNVKTTYIQLYTYKHICYSRQRSLLEREREKERD